MMYASYPSLNDKPCLITGGASGIGAALVEHFFEQGAQVGFIDVDTSSSDALCRRLMQSGRDRIGFEICDLGDIPATLTAIDRLATRFGKFEVLINNAGNDRRIGVSDVTIEDWDWQLSLNLRPHFFLSRHIADQVPSGRSASIINMGSISWIKGVPAVTPYAAAKSGIVGLTKCLAREFGPRTIRVNSIAPGWIMTDKQKSRIDADPETYRAALAMQAIPEPLDPGDIARLALWLAADDSHHCTGQTFNLDGGFT